MRRSMFLSRFSLAVIAGSALALSMIACSSAGASNDIVFTSERDSDNPDIYTVPAPAERCKG